MKKLVLIFIALLVITSQSFAQYVFESNAGGGSWTSAGTWTCRGDLVDCTGAPSIPGSTDIALISSNSATAITIPGNISVGDIYFMSDVAANKISKSALVSATITINGQLVGISPDLLTYTEPSNAVFINQGNLTLAFNGVNGMEPVIMSWGHNAPLPRTSFNTTGSISVESFSVRQPATFAGGITQIVSGHEIRDFSGTASLTVNSGATLTANGSIGRGTDPSQSTNRFNSITINGTMNTSSYVNAITFNVGATGALNVGFNNVTNQTQGWWYQSNAPTTISINPTSTVTYNANSAQNISATTYGNLSLTSTVGATKTLSGTGLTLQGNLVVGANVTFSPSSQVDFTGTVAQSISGIGTASFSGGIEVNKTSSSLTLSKALTVNGLTVTAGTLNLGDVVTSLTGSNSNSGIITSGTAGTLQTSGTTSFFGTGSTTVNNLTVSSGTTNFTGSASITGNLVNSGSLVLSTTSTVTFSGGNAQSISGNALSFGNITVNKTSSTLSNNANIELTGVLTVTTGTFDADGTGSGVFTLNSDTNGDASIGPMAGGSITGEVTFERYFNNTSNRWRNLSFPVSSVTYAELGTSLTLTANSLATYTESTLGNVDQGWTVVSGGTLNSTRGHTAWMYSLAPITISVSGPLLQSVPAQSGSPYNFGVTYTDDPAQAATQDGWNLVPNPFACPIDWTNSGWVKTNVNAAAAVWDVESNVYRYTNVDWNGIVAQGQAFWIQTNAAGPVLTCTESVKEAVSDPVFYRKAAEESRLMISLASGKDVDKTVIQFNEAATLEFDGEFDAYKLKNGIFNLSSITTKGTDLAANVIPKSMCSSVIRLSITNANPGSYTMSFDGIGSFTSVNAVMLIDHYTNHSVSINESSAYAFEITNDSKSFGSERFEIAFDFVDQLGAPSVKVEDGRLISNYGEGNQWYLNNTIIPGATNSTFSPTEDGEYYTVVNNGICEMQSVSVEFSREPSASRVFPNPATTFLKVDVRGLLHSNEPGEIRLHSVHGQLIRNQNFTKDDGIVDVEIEGMKPGVYIVSLISGGFSLQKSKVIIK